MIFNVFKLSLRNIRKFYFSSILHVAGFTIAITSAVLIGLYVQYEYSFDNFHAKKDSIYRLELYNQTIYPAKVGEIIESKLPEIKRHCTFNYWGFVNTINIESDDNMNPIKGGLTFTEESFPDIFTVKTLYGDVKNTLLTTDNAVVPESYAKKLFGKTDVIGKKITINENFKTTIGAVIKDIPSNGSIQNSIFVALKCRGNLEDWSEWSYSTFFEIHTQNCNETQKKIADLAKDLNNMGLSQTDVKLRPLKDIHFAKGVQFDYVPLANKTTVNILFLIGIFILIISIINFINFTTALLPLRSRGVSIRKVLGSNKWNLQIGLIFESILLATLATSLSLFAIITLTKTGALNWFSFNVDAMLHWPFFLITIALGLTIGFIAGIYPSRFITSQDIAVAVKSNYPNISKGKFIRGILSVFQFIISVTLIICMLFILKQRAFLYNYDTGLARNNIFYFKLSNRQNDGLINEILKCPGVIAHTFADHGPQNEMMSWGRNIDGKQVNYYVWPVGKDFLRFFNIPVIEGRDFSDNLAADKNNFIFNKAAIDKFGWESPIGKKLPGFNWNGRILGVAKNFNYASLHTGIMPLCFWLTDERANTMFVKYSGNTKDVISYIKTCYKKIAPGVLFEPAFIDDTFQQYYEKENKLAGLIMAFGIIAILISCIGIIGMSVFVAQYRTKEIGIRKVNGARVSEVILMLNSDFVKWIVIAFVIACPIAWYAMTKWLQNFAYKTELSWWVFAVAGAVAVSIAVLTVSWQSWKAATMNPVKSLRYE